MALVIVKTLRSFSAAPLPVFIKWPNDIYARVDSATGPRQLAKIGGILVNSQVIDNQFNLIIGCGINIANERPTVSLHQLMSGNEERPTMEGILARVLRTFDDAFAVFCTRGFQPFIHDYQQLWLHQDQSVTISSDRADVCDESAPRTKLIHGKIIGLSPHGLLRVRRTDTDGAIVELQPDGNSFNMTANMLIRKSKI
jgi:biotin--protein ligase